MGNDPSRKPIPSQGPEATYSGVRRCSQVPTAQEVTQQVTISQLPPPQATKPAESKASQVMWWGALALFGFALGAFLAQRVVPLLVP